MCGSLVSVLCVAYYIGVDPLFFTFIFVVFQLKFGRSMGRTKVIVIDYIIPQRPHVAVISRRSYKDCSVARNNIS
jgi:hypothetical protein